MYFLRNDKTALPSNLEDLQNNKTRKYRRLNLSADKVGILRYDGTVLQNATISLPIKHCKTSFEMGSEVVSPLLPIIQKGATKSTF